MVSKSCYSNCHLYRSLQTWLLQLTVTAYHAHSSTGFNKYRTLLLVLLSNLQGFSHITPVLRSFHWLRINICERQEFIFNTFLTTSQPSHLCDLTSVQPPGSIRSSSVVTVFRPHTSSPLKITNRSFWCEAHYLWHQLPESFREPHSIFNLCLTVSLPWSCQITVFISVITFIIYHPFSL